MICCPAGPVAASVRAPASLARPAWKLTWCEGPVVVDSAAAQSVLSVTLECHNTGKLTSKTDSSTQGCHCSDTISERPVC